MKNKFLRILVLFWSPTEFNKNMVVNSVTLFALAIAFLIRDPGANPAYLEGSIAVVLVAVTVVLTSAFKFQNLLKGIVFYLVSLESLYVSQSSVAFSGVCLFGVAVVFLFLQGVFRSKPVSWILALAAPLLVSQVIVYLVHDSSRFSVVEFLPEVCLLFLAVVAFKDRLLNELRPIPSLELSTSLTLTEVKYAWSFISGLRSKEIAFQFGISDSTVRNTLRNVVRKLELADTKDLIRLSERNLLLFRNRTLREISLDLSE